MRLNKSLWLPLIACYTFLSWWKWKIITASWSSLFAAGILLFSDSRSLSNVWNPDIMEYWIAGITWLCVGVLIVRGLLKVGRVPRKRNIPALAFIAVVAVIALCVPFLVVLPANMQGNLVTTRLLPPGSSAMMREASPVSASAFGASTIEKYYREATDILLHQSVIVGKDETFRDGEHSTVFFLFGTDDEGRDVLSRVIAGTRVSLIIGVSAAFCALLIGTLVGFAAGFSGRIIDSFCMRVTDMFLSIPSLFLVLGIIAMLGISSVTLVVVLALTGWMGIARTVRTEVKKLREAEFVLAAKLLDQSASTILVRHIVPNLRHVLLTAGVLQFANAVLAEASLSFLGLGIQPPTASWGNMLGQSLGYLRHGWWLGVFPGMALASVLIALHTLLEKSELRG